MSKLEYLNPADWSLHVIDGENDAAPEGWLLVPKGAEYLLKFIGKSYVFYKDNFNFGHDGFSDEWWECVHKKIDVLKSNGGEVIWQRESKSEVVEDVVNSPSHYTSGGIECLDAMQAMLSHDEFIGFLRGNIFKYNWRYKMKNGVEDLKKAKFYQEKLIEVEGE